MKKLSIIVPIYNVEKYVGECIGSLLKTECQDVEIILVNDGSTDGSSDVIREYAALDSRIVVADKKNGGCASARNYGIRMAEGEYVGFVDGDDFVEPHMFDKLLECAYGSASNGKYDYVYCGYNEFYEEERTHKEVLNDALGEPYINGVTNPSKIARLVTNTRVAIWRAIYKKEVIEKHNLYFHEELKRFDDLPFRVEYLYIAKSAICVPQHLYNYRLGRVGQDVACRDDRLCVHFDIFNILDEYVDALIEEGRSRRLREMLQIVKVCTHGFALSVIESEWKEVYEQNAKKDLSRNYGYIETVLLILKYTGKGNLIWYTRMMIDGKNKKQTK